MCIRFDENLLYYGDFYNTAWFNQLRYHTVKNMCHILSIIQNLLSGLYKMHSCNAKT